MKIRPGDTVLIISGKEKGKSGRVAKVLAEQGRVVVEGLNMRVRHIRKTAQQAGQRLTFEGPLSISNVMLLDPKTKKPTRVGYVIDEKTGRKSRIAKKSKEVIKGTATAKGAKPAKTDPAKALPAKKAFWERASDTPTDTSEAKGQRSHTEHQVMHALPKASRSENG